MDRLAAMATLMAAVETGSLSGASRKLGMPLATVSRKVAELESYLRTRLVNRTSRRLTLTDAGQSYVADCGRILADIEEAEHTAMGEYRTPRGSLTMTAPVVFGRLHVLPVVVEFLKTYPDIDVQLTLADRVFNLLEDHVDLALRIGALPDSRLIAARLGAVRLVTCGSPTYFAERGAPEKPSDLALHDCVTFTGLMPSDAWNFRSGKAEVSVPIRSRVSVNTAEAAIAAAIASAGVTRVLSYQVADAVRTNSLVVVLRDFEEPARPVSLVHAGQSLLPLKTRAFLDFATPRLSARLR